MNEREPQENFLLGWPGWLARKARRAAEARSLSLSAWIRQAIIEKLARDEAS